MNPEMDKYVDFVQGKSDERMPLFIKPEKKVSVRDVQNIMRDYSEDIPLSMTQDPGAGPYGKPYRWRPLTWEVDGVEYFNERAIATQQTGFSFVAQMRSWLPNAIGGILWFRSEEHTSELQSRPHLVCRLLLEKKKTESIRLLRCASLSSSYPPQGMVGRMLLLMSSWWMQNALASNDLAFERC